MYTAWNAPVMPPCLTPPNDGRAAAEAAALHENEAGAACCITGLVAPAEEREQRGDSHKCADESHHDEQGVEAHGSNSSTTSHSRKQASSSFVAVRTLNAASH